MNTILDVRKMLMPTFYFWTLLFVVVLVLLIVLVKWWGNRLRGYDATTSISPEVSERKAEIPFSDFNSRLSTFFPCPIGFPLAIEDPGARYLANRIHAAVEEVSGRLRNVVASYYPGVPDEEVNWMLLELKRFFFLSTVIGRTATYGYRVNYLWKQLTEDPEAYKVVLDALPDGVILEYKEPLPTKDGYGVRAEFEIFYRYLFPVYEVNEQLLGSFYPKPSRHLAPKFCKDIREIKTEVLAVKYFGRLVSDSQMVSLINGIIDYIREQIKTDPVYSYEPIRRSRQTQTSPQNGARKTSGGTKSLSRSSGYSRGGSSFREEEYAGNDDFIRGMLVGSMMTDSSDRDDYRSDDHDPYCTEHNLDSGSDSCNDSGGGYDGGGSDGDCD